MLSKSRRPWFFRPIEHINSSFVLSVVQINFLSNWQELLHFCCFKSVSHKMLSYIPWHVTCEAVYAAMSYFIAMQLGVRHCVKLWLQHVT